MKKTVQTIVASVAIASMTGCASTQGYFVDRGRDAADIFTATVGMGIGAKARVGPINLGAFGNLDLAGLRGGQYRVPLSSDFSPCDLTLTAISYETFDPYCLDISKERHKFFMSQGCAGLALAGQDRSASYRKVGEAYQPTRFFPVLANSRDIIPYYTQVEAAIGLGGTIRLGFNPGELIDFILGWTTIDIFGDDLEARKQKEKSNPASEGIRQPADGLPKPSM